MSNHFDNFQMPNNLKSDNTFLSDDHSNSSPNPSNHFNSNNIFNSNDNSTQNNSASSAWVKETGIIEKMLISYGFIQCCERQARLFFHFSQYLGNTNHLKIGDPVEYEMSYDRRTGKPVAINIRKITSNDFMTKLLKTERVSGVIATEVTKEREGRVAFENLGEFFFLPFTQEDVTDNIVLKAKDKVSFIIVTDEAGSYRSKNVQLEENTSKSEGVVHAIKDTFGFIERSDNSPNIFFHSSDCVNFKSLSNGDQVEFGVTTRKNKELAINVSKIVNNSEVISEEIFEGQVIKYSGRSNMGSGVLNCIKQKREYVFYDKDVKGNFTLCPFDLVKFQLVTDSNSQTQRPCNIEFNVQSFTHNREQRERGYIASLKETYGFIKCPSKEGSLIYFKVSELIEANVTLKLNDEVEFTYITDAQNKKCQAIRISLLPNGTLFTMFAKKPTNFENDKSADNIENDNYPLIDFNTELSDTTNDIAKLNGNTDIFSSNNNNWSNDLISLLEKDEKCQQSYNLLDITENTESIETLSNGNRFNNGEVASKSGIIVALKRNKETYGFIESIDGENEYFFHQSSYIDTNPELGQFVEFNTLYSNGKSKAIDVRQKPIVLKYDGQLSDVYIGIVLRTIKMFNDEQSEYTGSIARLNSTQNISELWKIDEKYDFSMISFKFLKDYISVGDTVKFQVGINSVTKKKRAYNVEVLRERMKGSILFLNRMYGFIKPEITIPDLKQIYFNKAEISGLTKLKFGDIVDFYLVNNQKFDKTYAIDIVKLEDAPEVTIEDRSLFKNLVKDKDTGPRVIIIRQPKAPDGSKGFHKKEENNKQ